MSFASFGIGLNALASGALQGIQIGKEVKGIQQQNKLDETMQSINDEAKANREKAVVGQVNTVEMPANGQVPANKTYMVGNKAFNTQEEATAAADKNTGDLHSFLMQGMPRYRDELIAQGQVEKASVFDGWMNNDKVQEGVKHYSAGMNALMQGDMEGAATQLKKVYNNDHYAGDGNSFEKLEEVKDSKGNVTGYSAQFKSNASGKTFNQVFDSQEDFYNYAAGVLMPMKAFEHQYEQIQAAIKLKADRANEDYKHTLALDLEDHKSANQNVLDANKSVRDAGKSGDEATNAYNLVLKTTGDKTKAQDAMTQVLTSSRGAININNENKEMSDSQLYMAASKIVAEQDWDGKLTAEETKTKTDELYGRMRASKGDSRKDAPKPTNPAANGLGLTPAELSPNAGITVVDTKIGQILKR